MRIKAGVGTLLLAMAACSPLMAEEQYDRKAALALSQAAIGQSIGDYSFRDTHDRPFQLGARAGKPLVVSLIYTSCHHVCPVITQNVKDKVEIAREALGEDAFYVVTIGFDWKVDSPEQMRMYASGRRVDVADWYFLSGDAATVQAISNDLGFRFFRSAKGFDHLSQTTIVDAEGVVYRQVYGADFDAPAFVEPLKELVFDTPRAAGLLTHWVDTFKLFCTVYDPTSGRYNFDYSIFMTILVGVLCLGAILTFIVREWRHAQ